MDLPFKNTAKTHSTRSSPLKLPLIFVVSVIFPALFLAYMGLRTVAGDTERALEEQVRVAQILQGGFEGIVQDAILSLRQNALVAAKNKPPIELPATAPIHSTFILDHRGNWIVPRISTQSRIVLAADFKRKMAAGERLEFAAQDIARALTAYRQLALQAADPTERAIALSAAARCARKQRDDKLALQLYTTVTEDYPLAFDESNAHLATYAHLQIADLTLGSGNLPGTLQTLEAWLDGLGQGTYPLGNYNGVEHALDRAKKTLLALDPSQQTETATQARIATLHRRLDHTRDQLHFYRSIVGSTDFAAQVALLKTSRDSVLYLSGYTSQEDLYLLAITPLPKSRVLGAKFDLKAIHTQLTTAPWDNELRRDGLQISILDNRAAVEFRRAHAEAMPAIAKLGKQPLGLQIGLHSKAPSAILNRYQQRRWLLFSLVLLLMATIGFGGYLVTRDASREINLSRLRSNFVSNVSHELRTPLASIRLYAETLLMNRFRAETERVECVETILRESERLSRLVDRVLDFSRMEAGQKTYRLQREDLAEITQSCLDACRYRFQQEGFRIQVDIQTHIPPLALDRDSVTEAILNLLDNAVKYSTSQKEITCRVYSDQDRAVVEVADRGIGIPAAEHSHIFATFYRVESKRLRVSGTGLGLTLVKHVMDAHQGQVEVESVEDQGSTFRLIFFRSPKNTEQTPC